MQLGQIAPHPDFPAAMRIMLGSIPGTDDLVSRIMVHPGYERYMLVSEWVPTAEELASLNAGRPVRLSILGPQVSDPEALDKLGMPHVALWAREEGEI